MKRRCNGEGTISRRRDGRFVAAVTLDGGRRKFVYTRTREEAARKLTELLKAKHDGLPIPTERQTVKDFLLSWLEAVRPSIRPRTWGRYSEYVNLHVIPELGRLPLFRLTPQHVQRLYARKREQGLSAATVRHLHAVLRKALADALRWAQVARNVAALVKPPRAQHRDMTTLTPEQARAFLAVARGERLEALYVAALTTGMRRGELLALRWKDVDLERRRLQVTATLQRTPDGFDFSEPKTTRSRRQILLGEAAVTALKQHRVKQAEERLRLGAAWDDRDLVFANEVGRPIEGSNLIQRSFHPVLERAGLPRIRFHDLRHTYATLALGQGVHPKVVSDALGHANIAITLDTYSHVTPAMHQQATDALDAVLRG